MTGGEGDVSAKMKSEDGERPQRMKDWLIEQINSGKYEGLNWTDLSKTVFKVPWIHAKKRGYDPTRDAALFKAWATHTGKYKGEGDATTWKINFRCALNGLKDIVELKEEQTENFRVYRLLPDTGKRHSIKPRNSLPPNFPNQFPLQSEFYPSPLHPFYPSYNPYSPYLPVDPEMVSPQWKQQLFPMPFHQEPMPYDPSGGKPAFLPVPMPPQTVTGNRETCIKGPMSVLQTYDGRSNLPPPYPERSCYHPADDCPIPAKRPRIKADPALLPGYYPHAATYSDDGQISPKIMQQQTPSIKKDPVPCVAFPDASVYPDPHPGYRVMTHSPAASSCSECSMSNVDVGSPLQPHMNQSPQQQACPVTPPYHTLQGSNPVNSPNPYGLYNPLTPPQNATPPTGPTAIQVSVCYNGMHRAGQTIACPHAGCHVFSDLVPQGNLTPHKIDAQLQNAFPFKLPHDSSARPILEQMGRGLLLEVVNGDVYLKNLTNLPCFYGSTPDHLSHVSVVAPETQEIIFSLASFKEALNQIPENPPSPVFAISIGQPWGQGSPLCHTSVAVVVTVLQAKSELQRLRISVPQEQTFFSPQAQLPGSFEEECQVMPQLLPPHQAPIMPVHSRPSYSPAVEP